MFAQFERNVCRRISICRRQKPREERDVKTFLYICVCVYKSWNYGPIVPVLSYTMRNRDTFIKTTFVQNKCRFLKKMQMSRIVLESIKHLFFKWRIK